jgi:hypothetical protein
MNDSARSQTLPLDGLPVTETLYTAVNNMNIAIARIIYEETTSSHAGVALQLGKIGSDTFYSTFTSEPSKVFGSVSSFTLAGSKLLAANETLQIKCVGGKTGLGSIKVQIELETI